MSKVHVVHNGSTFDLSMGWFASWNVTVDGKKYAQFPVNTSVSHTFTVPKKGEREEGDEADEYEVEIRYVNYKYSITVRKNGVVIHSSGDTG